MYACVSLKQHLNGIVLFVSEDSMGDTATAWMERGIILQATQTNKNAYVTLIFSMSHFIFYLRSCFRVSWKAGTTGVWRRTSEWAGRA